MKTTRKRNSKFGTSDRPLLISPFGPSGTWLIPREQEASSSAPGTAGFGAKDKAMYFGKYLSRFRRPRGDSSFGATEFGKKRRTSGARNGVLRARFGSFSNNDVTPEGYLSFQNGYPRVVPPSWNPLLLQDQSSFQLGLSEPTLSQVTSFGKKRRASGAKGKVLRASRKYKIVKRMSGTKSCVDFGRCKKRKHTRRRKCKTAKRRKCVKRRTRARRRRATTRRFRVIRRVGCSGLGEFGKKRRASGAKGKVLRAPKARSRAPRVENSLASKMRRVGTVLVRGRRRVVFKTKKGSLVYKTGRKVSRKIKHTFKSRR